MYFILDISAALTATIAAMFWFASASLKPPPEYGYGVAAPEDWQTSPSKSYLWAVKVARRNRLAAFFSGVTAVLVALSLAEQYYFSTTFFLETGIAQ